MSDMTSHTATKRAETQGHYAARPTIQRVEADGVRVFIALTVISPPPSFPFTWIPGVIVHVPRTHSAPRD